jgi:hypothetical protein
MNRGTGLPYRLLVAGWIGGLALLSPLTQAGGSGGPDLRTVFQGQQIHLPGGGTLPMADVLGHRPLVLQFLTPPCRRCEQDDDLIRQQSFEYADLGVAVINVYGGRDQAAIRAYQKGGQLGVPDLTDPTGELARQVGVGSRHQVLFVSASGGVVARLSVPFTSRTLLRELRALINF